MPVAGGGGHLVCIIMTQCIWKSIHHSPLKKEKMVQWCIGSICISFFDTRIFSKWYQLIWVQKFNLKFFPVWISICFIFLWNKLFTSLRLFFLVVSFCFPVHLFVLFESWGGCLLSIGCWVKLSGLFESPMLSDSPLLLSWSVSKSNLGDHLLQRYLVCCCPSDCCHLSHQHQLLNNQLLPSEKNKKLINADKTVVGKTLLSVQGGEKYYTKDKRDNLHLYPIRYLKNMVLPAWSH